MSLAVCRSSWYFLCSTSPRATRPGFCLVMIIVRTPPERVRNRFCRWLHLLPSSYSHAQSTSRTYSSCVRQEKISQRRPRVETSVLRHLRPRHREGAVQRHPVFFDQDTGFGGQHFHNDNDNDNDNDNETLREVPHPSNEGLALQARVSGPWPHKKESVLLV